MDGLNRQQLFAALIGLLTVLFVMGGLPGPWRRQLRAAAIAVFILALVAALVQIGLWLAEAGH